MLIGLPAGAEPPGHTVRVGVLSPIVISFDPATNRVAREPFAGLREPGYTPGPPRRRLRGKIANGAAPATLPVEEPSRFELVINLQAAKSMGFEVPHSLLMRADRVIE